MKRIPLRAGERYRIYAIDRSSDPDAEDCPAKSFIESMSIPSRRAMIVILHRHADHGPIKNVQKSRQLTGDIYEFKTRQGDRLYYFYAPPDVDGGPGLTILTHGSPKRKRVQLQGEIEKAQRLKEAYEEGNR